MREILIPVSSLLEGADGAEYRARIVGLERADGIWEGRIEFRSDTSRPMISTGVETTQPNRQALEYWASGLERIYLEGALERARWRSHRRGAGLALAEQRS